MDALELLKQRIINAVGEEKFNLLYKKYYDEIKKDLEVLRILKKHMWFSFHKELGFQVFCNEVIDLGNEEEFNLLKRQLKR